MASKTKTKARTDDDLDDSSAPLIEHLTELRTRIIWSMVAFIIAMVLSYTIWNPIYNVLTQPICHALEERGQECGLILLKLQEGFFVAVRISLLGGFVLAFPIIGYQMWRFVAPGLYRNEKAAFFPFLIASPVMFFIGGSFAFYVILPMAYDFFLGFQQGPLQLPDDAAAAGAAVPEASALAAIVFQGSVDEYLSLTIKFILAFGLSFQLPVLLTLMGKAGLVSAEGLGSVRRYAVVAILALAAVATPPDVISQVVLFVVIYGLYEVSIQLVARIERKREAHLRAQGLWVEDDEDEGDDPATAR
ncbi:twin-arginine translocase subunit TatC [Paracoccus gahaiensis]|uniref:Sec-independent protein translocase protein TatC n=1 Tax=Paracoccus gahaiensis TaxID=1706839 RepID=A0A4V6WIS9_9RHOB|nr:twin-arginine translocase subunit TatC [Paracoccus gahaiensis]TJZ92968.1 twin-arginine translocase subunit TatC [Paracoccus gahaiensis]